MRYLKMLGLAAIAALALAAVVGASTASAAVLCKTGPNKSGVCEGGKYTSGTVFNATSTEAKLVVTSGAVGGVTCDHSLFGFKNNSESDPLGVPGELTDWVFSNCHITGSATTCTWTTTSGYSTLLTPTSDTGNGSLRVQGSAVATVTCGGIFKCEYELPSGTATAGFTGGNPARIAFTLQTLTSKGGFGCGIDGHLSATYTLVSIGGSPTALWAATS